MVGMNLFHLLWNISRNLSSNVFGNRDTKPSLLLRHTSHLLMNHTSDPLLARPTFNQLLLGACMRMSSLKWASMNSLMRAGMNYLIWPSMSSPMWASINCLLGSSIASLLAATITILGEGFRNLKLIPLNLFLSLSLLLQLIFHVSIHLREVITLNIFMVLALSSWVFLATPPPPSNPASSSSASKVSTLGQDPGHPDPDWDLAAFYLQNSASSVNQIIFLLKKLRQISTFFLWLWNKEVQIVISSKSWALTFSLVK